MESLFFLDRPAKLADEIAQFVVFAVSVGEEVGALHVEGAFLSIVTTGVTIGSTRDTRAF